MTSWSYESDEVDNSSFDTPVLYARTLSCFHPVSPPKLRTTFTGVIGLPNNTMSSRRKVGFLLLLCSQINSVFKGLSLRRLEDIQRLTDSEQSLKSCRLLDLSAAFDTVDHDILLTRLQVSYGVKGSALAWIASFIQHRSQSVNF